MGGILIVPKKILCNEQGLREQIEPSFSQHVVLEEEHGKKQKRLPWNKNLNLDSATIVLGTCKNKCKMVDLEGGNVIKSNYVVENNLITPTH
jgi:hypothetical protein